MVLLTFLWCVSCATVVSIVFLKFIVFCLWTHPSTDSRQEALNAMSLLSLSSLAVFILICCTEWICYGCWNEYAMVASVLPVNHTVGTFGDVVLDVYMCSLAVVFTLFQILKVIFNAAFLGWACRWVIQHCLSLPDVLPSVPSLESKPHNPTLCIVYISCFVMVEHFNRYNLRSIINTNLLKTPF